MAWRKEKFMREREEELRSGIIWKERKIRLGEDYF